MSEFGREYQLGWPLWLQADEPLGAVDARQLLSQLEHRIESHVQPLATWCGSPLSGKAPSALVGHSWPAGVPGPLLAAELTLYRGPLPVLPGGRLPRLYWSITVEASAAPPAGMEPAFGIGVEVEGVAPSVVYPLTTSTMSAPSYVARRVSVTTPTTYSDAVAMPLPEAIAGRYPWVDAVVRLYLGQASYAAPVCVVHNVGLRLFGG